MSCAGNINLGYYHNVYSSTQVFQITFLKALIYNHVDLFFGKNDIPGIYIFGLSMVTYRDTVKKIKKKERRMLSTSVPDC